MDTGAGASVFAVTLLSWKYQSTNKPLPPALRARS